MLQTRWLQLMQNLEISSNRETYQELVKAYSEKHRHYHNLTHIEATLKHLDTAINLTNNPYEIELALWFHDSIYKPFSATNELDSANWATNFLTKNGVSKAITDHIHHLIMATLHSSNVNEPDEKLIVDIDLTILGCPSNIYEQFEKNVRQEYKWVPFFLYRKKRKEILNSFLQREHIYQTNFFSEKLETQARLNLNNAIASF